MYRLLAAILLMTLLTACATQQAVPPTETATPATPTEVPTEGPTNTPVQRNTLPPTWTESAADIGTQAVATDAPSIVNTAPPADTLDPSLPTAIVPTYSPSCDVFRPDLNRMERIFTPGDDVTVYWLPAEEAQFYRVKLLDDENNEVFSDFTDQTGYVFGAGLFEPGRLYFWQVNPVDSLGRQFCADRGSELMPEGFIGG